MSHVKPAINSTLLQLPNQILVFSSFPVSSPFHPSKRLLRSVCSYFLCSFLLRFPCFIFLALFPLHFLLSICCRSFLAPTTFISFSSVSFSRYYLFPFFSHISCKLCQCSVLPWRRSHLSLQVSNYKTLCHHIGTWTFLRVSSSFFFCDSAALGGHGFLIFEVSRSHSDTPHSVGILWTSPSQRRLSDNTQNSQETVIIASRGFKPTILINKRTF